MTNRVLCGRRGNQYGLWVTKAGKDVLTATARKDFLFHMGDQAVNVVQSGVANTAGFGGSAQNVSIVNQGFKPFVFAFFVLNTPDVGILDNLGFEILNSTTLRFYRPVFLGTTTVANGRYYYYVLAKSAI